MTRHLLIDADPIAWRACYQCPNGHAAGSRALNAVQRFVNHAGGGAPILCFSCRRRDCFRREFWPPYKANRDDDVRPEFYDAAIGAMQANHMTRCIPSLEADDIIGILATHKKGANERIVVADDKDMMTIPGRHFRPTKGEWHTVTPHEAARRHMLQTLVGDVGDNFPGCRGIGKDKAPALLDGLPVDDMWLAVVGAFVVAGLTEADALVQARVARILHATDYDLDAGRVLPWLPGRHDLTATAHTREQ